jgi:hypothetical protein
MASAESPSKHAVAEVREVKIDSRAATTVGSRRSPKGRLKLPWGAAGIAEAVDITVEVDEAVETDAWRLSIDMPACYISVDIDDRKQLTTLIAFLGMADPGHADTTKPGRQ